MLEKAQADRASGDNASAANALKSILASHPRNQELYFRTGVVLADLGELVNAENLLLRARSLGQPETDVLPVLGRVLLELEKYPEALDELKTDRVSDRSIRTDLDLLRARAHVGLGQHVEARALYLMLMDDRAAQARIGLARIAIAEDDRPGAERLIADVLAREPKSPDALMLRAEILLAENSSKQAQAVYEQLIKFDPRNSRALLKLATVLLNADQIDAARPILERGEKIEPSSPALRFAKGLLAFKEQRYEDARVELQGLFEMMPKHSQGLMLAGMVNYATAQYALAENDFGLYLERHPEDRVARRMLGAALLAKGQPQLAVNVLERWTENSSDVKFLAVAAEADRQVGKFQDAKTLLDKAIGLDAGNAELRTDRGLIEIALGSRDKAMADFQAAIALNPANARADEALVMMLLGRQEIDRAQRAADALEQRLPKSAEAPTLKGQIQLARKDNAKARENFERALQLHPTHLSAAEALAELDERAGKPDALRRRMEAILRADAHHLGALLALARLDLAEGRQAEGVAAIRRAISEHPESINALLKLADVQMRAGQAAEAVISARQARDLHPSDSRATMLLGDAQLATGDKQGAITTLTGLVAAQPKLVSAYTRLAEAYVANDNVDKATATVTDALKVDPANLDAKALLGEIFMRKDRLADALALAAEIQKNRPEAPLGYTIEGDALMVRKDFSRAAAAFQKAAALEPGVATLVRIHQAESAAQGGYASDVALRDWIAKHPDDTEARLYLTGALSGAGRHREAIDVCMEVLKRIPQSARALNNLAWALHGAGDDRALEYAKQAVRLDPGNATMVDTLGWILFGRGNTVEGVQTLLDAVALDGADPSIRYHLALALIKVGDVARARSELKTAVNGKPFAQSDEAKALLLRLQP